MMCDKAPEEYECCPTCLSLANGRCDKCRKSIIDAARREFFADEGNCVELEKAVACPVCEGHKASTACLGCDDTGKVPTDSTCVRCPARGECEFAFDLYNVGGDCLAEKCFTSV